MSKTRVIKPLAQEDPAPVTNEMTLTSRDAWEKSVFDQAIYFTVSRKVGVGDFATIKYEWLDDAMRAATVIIEDTLYPDSLAMLYAINAEGRSFCIPQTEWASYLLRWVRNVVERRNLDKTKFSMEHAIIALLEAADSFLHMNPNQHNDRKIRYTALSRITNTINLYLRALHVKLKGNPNG